MNLDDSANLDDSENHCLWRRPFTHIWLFGRRLLVSGLLLLAACQQPEVSVPNISFLNPTPTTESIIVTEVLSLDDGSELVITRVASPTPENLVPTPEPTIPVEPSKTELDLALPRVYAPLDPQKVSDQTTLNMVENLYAGLFNFNHFTDSLEPELVRSWSVSEDGLSWRFQLRDDFYWVKPLDGEIEQVRLVTADDAVYAIQRACAPQTQTPYVFIFFLVEGCQEVNGLAEANSADLGLVGATAVSETELVIQLTEPAGYFPTILTLPAMKPVPRDLIEETTDEEIFLEDGQRWPSEGVLMTSGPYMFGENDWESEERTELNLQANGFWPEDLGVEGMAELVTLYVGQDPVRLWLDDEVDLIPLPSALVDSYVNPPQSDPLFVTNNEVFYLGFNHQSRHFQTRALRQAFSLAIDREQLIEDVYNREGEPMRHLTPPGVIGAPPLDVPGFGHNPDRAFIELNTTGYTSCRGMGEIHYMIGASDLALQHAESLIDSWVEHLGCARDQFFIEQVQFGVLLAKTRPSAGPDRPDMFDLAWASFFPDAHNWLAPVLFCEGDNRSARQECDGVDLQISQAAVSEDAAERTQIYRDVENQFFGEGGIFSVAPLYVSGEYWLIHDWVDQNENALAMPNFGGLQWETIKINQSLKEIEQSQ